MNSNQLALEITKLYLSDSNKNIKIDQFVELFMTTLNEVELSLSNNRDN